MNTSEFDRQLEFLTTELGRPQSGRMRYAAAMYFCKTGKLTHKTLEIYRTLANEDNADPLAVAKASGGGLDIEHLIRSKNHT